MNAKHSKPSAQAVVKDIRRATRKQYGAETVLEATGGAGVDRIVEVEFGGNLAASNATIRPGGTIATYGSMADPNPAIPFYELMFKNVNLRLYLVYLFSEGVRASAVGRLTDALEAGALQHSFAKSFPLDDIIAAHELVESGKAIGNVIVTI